MAKRNHKHVVYQQPDPERIFEITLPEATKQDNPLMRGFTYRNVTMLVNSEGGIVTATFTHPSRCPTMEEIRVLVDRILPKRSMMIPVVLHTKDSHMVTAIDLPVEIKKGNVEDAKTDSEPETEVPADNTQPE